MQMLIHHCGMCGGSFLQWCCNGENMKKIIESLLGMSVVTSQKKLIKAQKVFLPYAAIETASPKGLLIVNRYYKPIGQSSDDVVHYNDDCFDIFRFKTKSKAAPVFFYSDQSAPWKNKENLTNYQNKIKSFFGLEG